jgi:hypothetical protein
MSVSETNTRTSLLRVAQLLVCSWRLAQHSTTTSTVAVLPDHGDLALDRALERAARAGLLPAWAAEALHFADGRAGRVCLELLEVLSLAAVGGLVEYSAYQRGHVVLVSPAMAGRFLERLGVSVEEARRLGEFLAREVAVP